MRIALLKTLTYRALGSLTTAAIVLVVTGELAAASVAGAGDLIIKSAVYYTHEVVWEKWSKFFKKEEGQEN